MLTIVVLRTQNTSTASRWRCDRPTSATEDDEMTQYDRHVSARIDFILEQIVEALGGWPLIDYTRHYADWYACGDELI